ncbi:hypothetical protein Glove_117g431 [Diversispora epigaea]|uniref:Uncharacterized protein n=1 Tax=Diversispora epigaea TaxID=1348612 RepID=A0A397J4Y8_9GLOM|nr:hypothetical protein Glove_117g431 [Diversispora epigaea]
MMGHFVPRLIWILDIGSNNSESGDCYCVKFGLTGFLSSTGVLVLVTAHRLHELVFVKYIFLGEVTRGYRQNFAKVVRKTEKKDLKLVVVWAIGVYPVDREDNEIEIVLFVPINPKESDPETQVIFEKDGFIQLAERLCLGIMEMTVSVSTGLTILDKAPNLNKCPLKVSLVGVPQDRDGWFYSVSGKIVPGHYGGVKRPKMTVSVSTGLTILDKAPNLNKCPLKVSLVGVPQDRDGAIFYYDIPMTDQKIWFLTTK